MADFTVNHLRRDQQEARKFLAQLESLLDALSANPHWTAEHRETFQHLSRYFEQKLCLLIRKEDEILYPALKGLFPTDTGPLSVLRAEHRSLCASFQKVSEIGRSLSAETAAPETIAELQRFGRKAVEILQDHLYKEERVLFPMVARFLTSQRDGELIEKMEALRAAHQLNEST